MGGFNMKLQVTSLIGSICVTLEDGEKLYRRIYPELEKKRQVELDFTGVNIFASPFFNSAIGQLFREFTKEDITKLLTIRNINSTGNNVLKKVIENSSQYYQDQNYKKMVDEVIDKIKEEE
jgi:hypothetical protein